MSLIYNKKKFSLFLIMCVAFIDWMGIGLVYPMFSSMLFSKDCCILPGDSSEATRGFCLGLLLTVMPLVMFFSAPILGTVSDQKGRKKLLVLSLAAGVLGYAVAVVSVMMENLLLLLFSRVILGISGGSAAVVEASVADMSTTEEKAKNFGLYNMACGLGFTIGPFLGGRFSDSCVLLFEGFSVPFLCAGIATFVNLIMIIIFFQETYIPRKSEKISWMMGIHNLGKAMRIKGLRAVFLCVFIACAGWSFYWEFIPVTWLSIYQFNTATVGNLYAYGAAVYALSSGLLIRPIVKRYSAHVVLFYGLLLAGASILAIYVLDGWEWLILYIPIQQYAIALFFPTSMVLVSNWVDETMQGEILGVLQSVQSLAFAVTPLIAGTLLSLSVSMPILVGGVAMVLAALVLAVSLQDQIFGRKAPF